MTSSVRGLERTLLFTAGICISLLSVNIFVLFKNGIQGVEIPENGQGGEEKDSIYLQPSRPKLEDYISLKELEQLSKCPIEKLKRGALQIIIDRAMSEPHLTHILHCAQSKVSAVRKKALISLHQLSQHGIYCTERLIAGLERNKSILVKRRVLKILTRSFKMEMDEIANRHAVATLYHLVVDHDKRKIKLCGYNVVEILARFLKESPGRYNDLKYWSVLLIHQFSLTEAVTNYLIDSKIIFLMVDVCKLTFGNPSMQKLCFHSIVRILSTFEDEYATSVLNQLAEMNLISLASACLRNNDSELCQWTLFLIHEFAIRNVHIDEIVRIKGLLKIMVPFVENNENIIPRIILRTLKIICEAKLSYYKELRKVQIVPIVLKCIGGGDEQTQYWSLSLLHILVYQMGNHRDFFDNNGLDILLKLCNSKLLHVRMYVIEILSVLCADPANVRAFEGRAASLLEGVLSFLYSSELELRHSASSLLVSLVAASEIIAKKFTEVEGLLKLASLFLGDDSPESLRPIVCKGLICVANTDKSLQIEILVNVFVPGIYLVFHHMEYAISMCTHYNINDAARFSFSKTASIEKAHSSAEFPVLNTYDGNARALVKLSSTLECLSILCSPEMIAEITTNETYIEDICDDIASVVVNSLVFPLLNYHDYLSAEDIDLKYLRQEVAIHGMRFIHSIMKIERIRSALSRKYLLVALERLLFEYGDALKKEVVVTIGLMITNGFPSGEHAFSQTLFYKLLEASLTLKSSEDVWLYFNLYVREICDYSTVLQRPSEYIYVTKRTKLNAVDIFHDDVSVSNRLWTFESAFGSHGIRLKGKYAYEFHLGSSGVIQIGWASGNANFNEFGGWGVGDYCDSFSFDGSRVRKWNGRDVDEDTYGVKWNENDTVTCLFDLNEGSISFLLNGTDLGVAFRNVNTVETWYPAVSLTGGQWGRFKFGSKLDPLRFCPKDYLPISSILPLSDRIMAGVLNIPLNIPESIYTPLDSISAISFYYEVRIGLNTSNKCSQDNLQIGCVSNSGMVACLTYNRSTKTLYFLRFFLEYSKTSSFDSDVNAVTKEASIEQGTQIHIASIHHAALEEAVTIGVGVVNSSGSLYVTLDGLSISTNLKFEQSDASFTPYFRNIPRYLLNLGQFDFINAEANVLYSPSKKTIFH